MPPHTNLLQKHQACQRGHVYGDYRSRGYRFRFRNSFPYARLEGMIKYKAAWEGLPTIQLTKSETSGTTMRCPEYGPLTRKSSRKLYCEQCNILIDRYVNACINQARMGRIRFMQSFREEKGPPAEAVKRMAGSQIQSTGPWQSRDV